MPLSWQAGVDNYGLNLSTPSFRDLFVIWLHSELHQIIFYIFFPRFPLMVFLLFLSISSSTKSRIYDLITRYDLMANCLELAPLY